MSAFAFSLLERQHLRAVAVAARGDLVGDVAHLEQGGDRLGLGDEGADALDADQPPVQRQLAQGPVDGHAADAEVAHQLRFRGDAVTRLPLAGIDAVGDHALDARIAGQKFDIQRIHVRSCLDRLMPDMICNHKGSSPIQHSQRSHTPMKVLYAPHAWLADGWQSDVRIAIDTGGTIRSVSHGAAQPDDERLAGPLLPGMPNLHSHAFQRAMAGLAEEALNPEDSFWTWRELMYRLVGRLTPEQVQAIATHPLYRDAEGRLHLGRRVPLSASPAGRHGLCEPRGDGGAHRWRGGGVRHRPDGAAGLLCPWRLRRAAAGGEAAALQERRRALSQADRGRRPRMPTDRRALGPVLPFAARRDRGRHEGGAGRAWRRAADPHPHRRADQGSAGLPRLVATAGRWSGCTTSSRSTAAGA